jgi:hypothetical protein
VQIVGAARERAGDSRLIAASHPFTVSHIELDDPGHLGSAVSSRDIPRSASGSALWQVIVFEEGTA